MVIFAVPIFCSTAFSEQQVQSAGHIIQVKLNRLKPTQAIFGKYEVKLRRKKIRSMSRDQIKKYLFNKPIPAILGPDNYFYIIDRHHLVISLIKENIDWAYVVLINPGSDLRSMNPEEFMNWMNEKGFLYLKDQNGKKIPANDLPQRFLDLKNEPYRSLAGAVEQLGAFKKTIPYAENIWADFFRNYFDLRSVEKSFDKVVQEAVNLALSEKASAMPGFIGSSYTPTKCENSF